MDQDTAERIAMALEGIELQLKRQADVAEAAHAWNQELVAEQKAAQAEFQRQMRLAGGMPGGPILRG